MEIGFCRDKAKEKKKSSDPGLEAEIVGGLFLCLLNLSPLVSVPTRINNKSHVGKRQKLMYINLSILHTWKDFQLQKE